MSRVVAHHSISLDGFTAGPGQTLENPMGTGFRQVFTWMFQSDQPGHEADAAWAATLHEQMGACVMGRNMFGPVRGEWDSFDGDWRGWWDENPPYHCPVFVLTHHEREPLEMEGGTTFHFVTGGFDAAFALAREAAGDLPVRITGGASTVRQALNAGVVDELTLDIAPFVVGAGERLFDGVTDPGLTPIEVVQTPLATHVRYRVGNTGSNDAGSNNAGSS